MRLSEVEMIKLLPSWMAQDGADRGLAAGCDTLSRDAFARLKLLSRWDKIDQLSEAELDEMAWEPWGENLTGAFRVDVTKPVYTPVSDTQVAKFSGHLTVSHKTESEVV